mmetsp:Transcript_27980/g.45531  ORF Transcript_27980/g.45531 Transcript_27980/m.45531 type:complete len:80 (-) Transcript_27980:53-292(-)
MSTCAFELLPPEIPSSSSDRQKNNENNDDEPHFQFATRRSTPLHRFCLGVTTRVEFSHTCADLHGECSPCKWRTLPMLV